eukprot:2526013-Prymnesium_polylepis.1
MLHKCVMTFETQQFAWSATMARLQHELDRNAARVRFAKHMVPEKQQRACVVVALLEAAGGLERLATKIAYMLPPSTGSPGARLDLSPIINTLWRELIDPTAAPSGANLRRARVLRVCFAQLFAARRRRRSGPRPGVPRHASALRVSCARPPTRRWRCRLVGARTTSNAASYLFSPFRHSF